MPSEIEKIWVLDTDDDFSENYRTSCQCTCEDHSIDFGVNVDVSKHANHPNQVWLDVSVQTHSWSDVWDKPKWSYPFRSFWSRLKTCKTLLFRGYVETHSSFIFRGNEQIDEFVETIVEAQNKANKKVNDEQI